MNFLNAVILLVSVMSARVCSFINYVFMRNHRSEQELVKQQELARTIVEDSIYRDNAGMLHRVLTVTNTFRDLKPEPSSVIAISLAEAQALARGEHGTPKVWSIEEFTASCVFEGEIGEREWSARLWRCLNGRQEFGGEPVSADTAPSNPY